MILLSGLHDSKQQRGDLLVSIPIKLPFFHSLGGGGMPRVTIIYTMRFLIYNFVWAFIYIQDPELDIGFFVEGHFAFGASSV